MTKLTIGLIGGAASGKSTAGAYLTQLGAQVFDVDQIARELTAKGSPIYSQIVLRLGRGCLRPDGQLNRQFISDLIFYHSEHKTWLEKLLHPAIQSQAKYLIDYCQAPVIVLMVPLLTSRSRYALDLVWALQVPRPVQLARLQARDNCSLAKAQAIIKSQPDPSSQAAISDAVIVNAGCQDSLYAQLARMFHDVNLSLPLRAAAGPRHPL